MTSSGDSSPILHVVLYQPEIPQNTGNIGRSCLAIGAKLWLVRPLGFHLDDRYLKRAGMDYWRQVNYETVDSWDHLRQRLQESGARIAALAVADSEENCEPAGAAPLNQAWLLTKHAEKLVWDAEFRRGDVLVFGSETSGLPESMRSQYAKNCIKLPMLDDVRSLNLASTANTVMYEAVRQLGGLT